MEPRKHKLLTRARNLYAEGLTLIEVADVLGLSERTLWNWKKEGERQERSWEEERECRQRSRPARVLKTLEGRFGRMVAEVEEAAGEESVLESRYEERLLKLLKVIDLYRRTQGDPAVALSVLEKFVRFCVRTLDEDELEVIREAVDRYMRQLKRKEL